MKKLYLEFKNTGIILFILIIISFYLKSIFKIQFNTKSLNPKNTYMLITLFK
jgi:hypothetical protein